MKLKGPSQLLDIAQFTLELLGVSHCDLQISYAKNDEEASECVQLENGDFLISIERGLDDEQALVKHVGHECVHLKQFKRDELVSLGGDYAYWKGEKHEIGQDMSDEYFLTPWEMEARALEDWILHRWNEK